MLLEPDPARLRPHSAGPGEPKPDRVPPERAAGTPPELLAGLTAALGGRGGRGAAKVEHRISDLVRWAADASPYRFVPQAVIVAEDIEDVRRTLAYATRHGRDVVFRAGGSSLNGQAQGEDLLVEVRRHWTGVELLPDGVHARIRPGTTVARANAHLARHGRVLGPDPASSIVATIGGVIANNACGMTAGTVRNSYRMMTSATVVLPSGTVIDTAGPDADTRLREAEPDLHAGLLALREEITADPGLVARIREKYQLKNTSGYRLDSFLDAAEPVRILRGLMVGSEGTLGFVAEAVFETLPLDRIAAAGLFLFPDLASAAAAVPAFNQAGARAVELMDGNTIRACAQVAGVPADWAEVAKESAALLVEFRAPDAEALDALQQAGERLLPGLELIAPVPSITNAFTRDKAEVNLLWKARKAFVTAVGKARAPGTTLITEDFAVPPERLAEACEALLGLQAEHGFDAAVAGHAAHGNLHFLLAFDASVPADVDRYAAFIDDFCHLTVDRFQGSLKGEHATGRNMAPFLELEWGAQATALMWRIKELFDPHGVLAPRVVLDRDPKAHLRGLKSIPQVGLIADPCIECGFCEPVCPSRDLTTSPRQRIALRREMLRQPVHAPADSGRKPQSGRPGSVLDELVADYGYDAVDTCAGDSTCALACPVGIDTGAWMKEFRHERHNPREERVAERTAAHFGILERGARLALGAAQRVPDGLLTATTGLLRKAVNPELVPEWLPGTPGPARGSLPQTRRRGASGVYFTACVNRIFGPSGTPEDGDGSVTAAVVALSERAGRPVWLPGDLTGSCCATIWHSKGYERGNALMANRTIEQAWDWTDGGRLPLIVDASSCTLGLLREVLPHLTEQNRARHAELEILDAVQWADRELLPRLTVHRRRASMVVHPTCSTRHLDLVDVLRRLAEACAERVDVPVWAECCGFAGDRGFLHKELTESATARERDEIARNTYEAYVSANRTCELGMEHATGRPFRSVLLDLEWATREETPIG